MTAVQNCMGQVLLVPAGQSVCDCLVPALRRAGFEIRVGENPAAAACCGSPWQADVIVVAVEHAAAAGFQTLQTILQQAPRATVVMLANPSSVADAVLAMKLGATDYRGMPIGDADLVAAVRAAIREPRTPPRRRVGLYAALSR